MNQGFWGALPCPIIGLAPMNGVSDHPFRHVQAKYGRPMLIYTEFVAVERLDVGDRDLLRDLRYDESQRPIVAQLYGHEPARFRRMALLACALGFDGIDINMGCPSRSIVHRGAGAGLIRTPAVAQAVVRAAQAGVADWCNGRTLDDDPGTPPRLRAAVAAQRARLPAVYQARRPLPVSVKTRIGYEAAEVNEWIPRLLEVEPAAVALHGRTLRQAYAGRADWDAIGAAARHARGTRTQILGNGDVATLDDARQRAHAYGLDGVLIGRASYGNPAIFRGERMAAHHLLHVALEHARLFEACTHKRTEQWFLPMRKHLAWYVRGLPGAAQLRHALMQTFCVAEAEQVVADFLSAGVLMASAQA